MEKFETTLTLMISFVSAAAALLTAIYRLLDLYRSWSLIEDEILDDLSRDIVRLEEMLQRQKAELERLQQREKQIGA